MNCADIHTILDEHRDAQLNAAERRIVDAHLLGCEDCTAAWHANSEMRAIAVPTMAPAFLDSVLPTIDRHSLPTYAARRSMIIATALLAGAALAAIGVTQLRDSMRDERASTPAPATPMPAVASGAPTATTTSGPAPAQHGAGSLPVDVAAIELSVIPLVRVPPNYPMMAIERGLQGSVTLRYDVSASGVVENVRVLESTDAVFEEAASTALAQWKYLPRVAAGKRIATPNQETVIRFQLDNTPAPRPTPTPSAEQLARAAKFANSSAAVEIAWKRVLADDFRGAELQLDEVRALYAPSGAQEGGIWDFYAYIYVLQGNYDRAIDAYETAFKAYAEDGTPALASSLALANLYFARHQYGESLRTLLRYKQSVVGTRFASGQPNPIVEGLIDRLRVLGVTEDTLPPTALRNRR